MAVEVAQVVRGDERFRPQQPSGSSTSAAICSPKSSSSRGSTGTPARVTPVSQLRWLRPTWVRSMAAASASRRSAKRRCSPIATLHRPIARCPSSRSARVTMPTGLVKFTIHAPGLRRRTRSAISSTTGTVRMAFASPPAPVVSCPMHPQVSGHVSSRARAACPPMRSCSSTAAASVTASSRSLVVEILHGLPVRTRIRRHSPATTARRCASGSMSASSSTASASRAMPSTNSGV